MFSRKRKSFHQFFKLLKIYADKNVSLETLWSFYDAGGSFDNYKTLQSYFSAVASQIDEILSVLSSHTIILEPSIVLEDITPDNATLQRKLELLFVLIDRLMELLHQKGLIGIITDDEKYFFIHAYLFQKAEIVFLNTS